jgi:hypothetical protein
MTITWTKLDGCPLQTENASTPDGDVGYIYEYQRGWWCSVWMGREDGQEDDSYFKTKAAAKAAIIEECTAI